MISLVVQWLRLCVPSAEGLSSDPRQETRSHMPQLRVHTLQLKTPHATTKKKKKIHMPQLRPSAAK